jgi:hypothetical protein
LKNKNILKHIPSMMRKRWVVRSCYAFQCKCESIHKKPHKEEEEGKERLGSFNKHSYEKMKMPFFIVCSFLP